LCLIASGFTDMQVCGLRPTFAYGPRQNPNLITYVQQCVRREHPVRLMGGSQTRDPIYVEDLARAFVAAAFTPAARNCALPVGGGCEISVADLSRSVVRLLDGDIDVIPEAEPPRRTEIWRSYCDNAEAGALLGWSPNVSLEEGLTRTLRAEPPEYHATAPLQTPFLGELR
jgi:UDP-glucose 4-epimerase